MCSCSHFTDGSTKAITLYLKKAGTKFFIITMSSASITMPGTYKCSIKYLINNLVGTGLESSVLTSNHVSICTFQCTSPISLNIIMLYS